VTLIPVFSASQSPQVELPARDDNLFERLIRNPRPGSSNPRERECTEMLCALLRNTAAVQVKLIDWMAEKLGVPQDGLPNLQYEFLTEQSIEGKRDDLRIIGNGPGSGKDTPIVLWTIEVKVGAGLHESTTLQVIDDEDDTELLVNQLENYDHWLQQQDAVFRGGLVLAVTDQGEQLPASLQMPWACVTWTELGMLLQQIIEDLELSDVERFLASHVLGFIKTHLWRRIEMDTTRLEFDDIALLKAFREIGLSLEKKVDALVGSLHQLAQRHPEIRGEAKLQSGLYKPSARSVLYLLYLGDDTKYPYLYFGITSSGCCLWLETAPTSPEKHTVRNVISETLHELESRNASWHQPDQAWTDLSITLPLEELLVAPDQEERLTLFLEGALDDLRAVKLSSRLSEALASKSV
jgi:hypothetical protein